MKVVKEKIRNNSKSISILSNHEPGLKIAIIGTRGIPNCYGGFEQCAEFLSLGLVRRGHHVTVYNSHNHPWQKAEWNGVRIKHCYDPEYKLGTVGQFIYDFNCIKTLQNEKFDVVLQLGYTSSSIWGWMLPKNCVVTTNMDGLEWQRSKYSRPVQRFLQLAEQLGVRFSDHLISDSIGIQKYLKEKYNKDSAYLPYGANLFDSPDSSCLEDYFLNPFEYDLLIARLEPENSIEVILDGVALAATGRQFLVIGNHETPYGDYLKNKFKTCRQIRFLGGIYDMDILNNIRYFGNIYFHGHTVGGTNPSLLEAMASNCLICANENLFNKYILGRDAFYFKTKEEVADCLKIVSKTDPRHSMFLEANRRKIETIYSWDKIVEGYSEHFKQIMGKIER